MHANCKHDGMDGFLQGHGIAAVTRRIRVGVVLRRPSAGDVTFLVDAAPHDRLREDQRLELFEGLKTVAVVDVPIEA